MVCVCELTVQLCVWSCPLFRWSVAMKHNLSLCDRPHSSAELARRMAVELRLNGMSAARIAKRLHMHRSTVYRALQRQKRKKRQTSARPPGRPSKLTAAVRRQITGLLRDRTVGSVRKVAAKLKLSGLSISKTTVWEHTRKTGMRSRVPIPRPLLTEKNRAKRLEYALKAKHMFDRAIRKMCFSDEKTFVIGSASSRVWLLADEEVPIRTTRTYTRCFRPPTARRASPQCPLPRCKTPCFDPSPSLCCDFGLSPLFRPDLWDPLIAGKFPLSVKVSGVISFLGPVSLVVFNTTKHPTAKDYKELLLHEHIPALRSSFAQDNVATFTFIRVLPPARRRPGPCQHACAQRTH